MPETWSVGATELEALLDAGRTAWPKISLAPSLFEAHVARHVTTPEALASVHASDLYLACGVLHRDRAALGYFEEKLMARVPEYVLRVRVGRELVDDIQQKLREDLVMGSDEREPKIADYSGRGALGGWLRIAAVRTALNQVRAMGAGKKTEELGDHVALSGDPELAYVKEHAHDIFASAFKRVLDGLDANERTILRLHYIDGLTMDQLAHLYKTPRSTIARRVSEARQQILASTESLLRDEKKLSPSAVASVIRQARSRLDVTITRLFR